jgi:hypothetical protein
MTEWPEGWRPKSPEEAEEYLDVHPPGTGDDEIVAACTALLDEGMFGDGDSAVTPFPKPPEEQLEERGAD